MYHSRRNNKFGRLIGKRMIYDLKTVIILLIDLDEHYFERAQIIVTELMSVLF